MDDHALMGVRADTLWTYDGRGRMLRSNEPDSRPAPRLWVGRTTGGHVVRFGVAVPEDVAREVATIVEHQLEDGGMTVPASLGAALRPVLERHGPIKEWGGGPAY